MDTRTAPNATSRGEPADDLSALAWVQDELRRTLEAAHKSLRRCLKEAEALGGSDVDTVDPAVLRSARSSLHQGVGALELVGLPSVAVVLRASEAARSSMGWLFERLGFLPKDTWTTGASWHRSAISWRSASAAGSWPRRCRSGGPRRGRYCGPARASISRPSWSWALHWACVHIYCGPIGSADLACS